MPAGLRARSRRRKNPQRRLSPPDLFTRQALSRKPISCCRWPFRDPLHACSVTNPQSHPVRQEVEFVVTSPHARERDRHARREINRDLHPLRQEVLTAVVSADPVRCGPGAGRGARRTRGQTRAQRPGGGSGSRVEPVGQSNEAHHHQHLLPEWTSTSCRTGKPFPAAQDWYQIQY